MLHIVLLHSPCAMFMSLFFCQTLCHTADHDRSCQQHRTCLRDTQEDNVLKGRVAGIKQKLLALTSSHRRKTSLFLFYHPQTETVLINNPLGNKKTGEMLPRPHSTD